MAEPKRKRDAGAVEADLHQEDKESKKRKKPVKKDEEEDVEEEEDADPNDGEGDNEDEENGEKEEQEEEEKTDGKLKWEEFDNIEDDPFSVLAVKPGTEYNNEEVKAEDQVEALALLGKTKAALEKLKLLEDSDRDFELRVNLLAESIEEVDKVFIYRLPSEGKEKEKKEEEKGKEEKEEKVGLELCFIRTSDAEYIIMSDDHDHPARSVIVGVRGCAALLVCSAFAYTNIMPDGVESIFPPDQDFDSVPPKLLIELAEKYFKMFCANQLPEPSQKKGE